MKKYIFILILLSWVFPSFLMAQNNKDGDTRTRDIYALIDQYSLARDKKDTILLKSILTQDVDQLVSSGEWRNGVNEAVQGMLKSSDNNPGTRTLRIEKIRFLDARNAITDARYEIKSREGITRKMWSTFILVNQKGQWKIAAIRNMLPSVQP